MDIRHDVPLAPYTTFRIGGPARHFAEALSLDDVRAACAFAQEHALALRVIGGGSNLLVNDAGFDGFVMRMISSGITHVQNGDTILLTAQAGESWDELVAYAVAHGWWGIENLSGIPGTVGAAPVQNIGAYGAELADVFVEADVFDRTTGATYAMSRDACGFGYRTSMFKKQPERFVICSVTFALARAGALNLSYTDLAKAFEGSIEPALDDIRAAVLRIRSRKFPDLAQEGTAGSFFLNPVVSQERAAALADMFPGIPTFRTIEGIKVSLAWLLDKGLSITQRQVGGARQFETQPIVLVASNGASARDVDELASMIERDVLERAHISLQREVRAI